jgi:hypothetical protein
VLGTYSFFIPTLLTLLSFGHFFDYSNGYGKIETTLVGIFYYDLKNYY